MPHLTREAVDKELRAVCAGLEIRGVGSYSFRCTALTTMKDKNILLRNIAAISGHEPLNGLARYLEVSKSVKSEAIAALTY